MRTCALCGRSDWIERHHVFGGGSRKQSEEYGAVADLCHWCHNEPPDGVHHNQVRREELQAQTQRQVMENYGMTAEDFRLIFGKSYV